MSILFVLIPLGLALLATAIAFFFWAVRSGQFDDLEDQGSRILFDEELPVRTAPDRAARPGAAGGPR